MKAAIVFDSIYGCTKNVGEIIGEILRENGWDVEYTCLAKSMPEEVDADILFLGSPTRMGKATRKTRKFLKKDVLDSFSGIVVAFDTIMRLDPNDSKAKETKAKFIDNGAAPTIREILSNKNLNVYSELLRVEVSGLKGPLVDDAEDAIRLYVHQLLISVTAT